MGHSESHFMCMWCPGNPNVYKALGHGERWSSHTELLHEHQKRPTARALVNCFLLPEKCTSYPRPKSMGILPSLSTATLQLLPLFYKRREGMVAKSQHLPSPPEFDARTVPPLTFACSWAEANRVYAS